MRCGGALTRRNVVRPRCGRLQRRSTAINGGRFELTWLMTMCEPHCSRHRLVVSRRGTPITRAVESPPSPNGWSIGMRAAVLEKTGQTPVVRDFEDPDGDDVVDVRLAGCNPVDLALASGQMGEPDVPKVVGKEGIGLTADRTRVYFDSPPSPFGSWAQRTRVDPTRVYPVPDGVDDELAVALGIAGLAAWLPLTRHAHVEGKSVLVLGATGVVGNIAVQAAKLLYAARVIAAGRNADALEKTRDLGADAIVRLGDDARSALRRRPARATTSCSIWCTAIRSSPPSKCRRLVPR